MGAMDCDQERRGGEGVEKETIVSRIVDSILGKRRTWEGPSSIDSSGPSAEEVRKEVPGDVSLRKLRQIYSRAVKTKVAARQYLDVSGSESEFESEGESDPKDSARPNSSVESDHNDGDSSEPAGGSKKQQKQKNVCDQCGITVKKRALLIQHRRTHSEQRPFVCPMSGCGCAYKRQDHLNRHLTKHQGAAFVCPQPGCDQTFTLQANLQRHLKHHDERKRARSSRAEGYFCSWPDCGKSFCYPSLLRTHESYHDKRECTEFVCMYPGCGDMFSCEKTLVTHAETSHPYLLCEVCGETIPRKSFLRHARTHATKVPLEVVCPYDDCGNTYTRESNLRQHVRSVHLKLKPFTCSHEGCNQKYAHKAARDRHEQSMVHSQPRIDFHDQDELCLSKSRGGRKPVEFERVAKYLRSRRIDELCP